MKMPPASLRTTRDARPVRFHTGPVLGEARGSALVMALILLVLLVTLATAAATTVRLRVRAARANAAEVQCTYLAQAGIHLAKAVLRRDDTSVDSLEEEWATLGDHGAEAFPLGTGWFRVEIIDAASRVNINAATKEMLMHLPGVDDALSDAILDWRESGETPRPAGAKADYYQALPEPYLPREGPFETVGELLLVRDVTPALLYGPPQETGMGEPPSDDRPLSEKVTVLSQERNVNAEGEARVNINEATPEELMGIGDQVLGQAQAAAILQYRQQRGTFSSLGELFSVPGISTDDVRAIVDHVTVTSSTMLPGRVNVNTASEELLAMVPGLTPETAAAIIQARDGDHGPFESIGELLEPDLLDTEAFSEAVDHLCTRSAAFLVRAMGRVRESRRVVAIEALVERTGESTRIVRWMQVERAPGWIAWGWPRRTADPETGGEIAW
ncbi:MAG TPA: type II secretion system protein GspK [Armatimonadota bacterium]|nr:type II secretion system protein GspK [Armatimonadota bacterium]